MNRLLALAFGVKPYMQGSTKRFTVSLPGVYYRLAPLTAGTFYQVVEFYCPSKNLWVFRNATLRWIKNPMSDKVEVDFSYTGGSEQLINAKRPDRLAGAQNSNLWPS